VKTCGVDARSLDRNDKMTSILEEVMGVDGNYPGLVRLQKEEEDDQ